MGGEPGEERWGGVEEGKKKKKGEKQQVKIIGD